MIKFEPYTGPVREDGSPDMDSPEWETYCAEQFWFMACVKKPKFAHSFTFDLYMPLPSLTNQRISWQSGLSKKKKKRQATYMETLSALNKMGSPKPKGVIHVDLTRMIQGGHKLDESNLPAAFKSIEDGIADAFGVNDGDDSKWKCEHFQMKPEKQERRTGIVRVSWN